MNRLSTLTLGLMFVAFISGLGFGVYLGSGSSTPAQDPVAAAPRPTTATAALMEGDSQDSPLKFRVNDLEQEIERLKADQGATTRAKILDFYKKYGSQMRLSGFQTDLKVTPEMAELLSLSAVEQKAVEAHLEDIAKSIEELSDADTSLVKQSGNEAHLRIAANAEAGAALKSSLQNLLTGDIGADRAGILMGSGGFDEYGPFAGFAQNNKDVTISWDNAQPAGGPRYTIKIVTGNSAISTTGAALPPQFQKFIQVDPSP